MRKAIDAGTVWFDLSTNSPTLIRRLHAQFAAKNIALLDARKGLNMFRKVDVPVLGIVENMSYYECPNCGHRAEIFAHGGARREAEKLGVEFLGEIPLDIAIRETSDGGTPIVVSQPDSPHARAYRAIADRLWVKIEATLRTTAAKAPRIVVQ